MAPPSWTETIDNLFTSTWAYRKPQVVEQAYLKTPFIFWLNQAGRVEKQGGYRRIEVPVEYGSNENVRWISKGDTVPLGDDELITLAYEDWKYLATSIVRWLTEDQQNRGKAAAVKMVERKLGAAERALWEEFERVVFTDGTGTNEPNGLQNLVAIAPTTGTVHGLNRATYTWWRNQYKSHTGSASVYLLSDMSNCMNSVIKYSRAEIKDLFIITDQTSFELYESVHQEMKILPNAKLADAGFDSFSYKGRPMVWSPSAPSGYMYFLNPNYLKLVIDDNYWMEMTNWKEVPDQPFDKVAQIVCTMNLIVTRPIVNNVLYGITA
jgi:hypothetical protein